MRFNGQRIRRKSPVDTKRGAQEYERQLRERLLAGEPICETDRKEIPTLEAFSREFMATYVRANNKPSERISKECILRNQLIPAFGRMRLDAITRRDVETYKARSWRLSRPSGSTTR